jgi:hypothetical protein
LMAFLPRRDFDRCVRQYRGNYRTRRFSCFDQWLCMAFAQLTYTVAGGEPVSGKNKWN